MTTFAAASTSDPWILRLPEILSGYFRSLDPFGWALLLVALLVYVLMTYRVARQMRRIGRNGYVWFVVSFFLTAVPASFMLVWHNFGWLVKKGGHPPDSRLRRGTSEEERADAPVRCPRCARRVSPAEIGREGGVRTCPRCGAPWDEDVLA